MHTNPESCSPGRTGWRRHWRLRWRCSCLALVGLAQAASSGQTNQALLAPVADAQVRSNWSGASLDQIRQAAAAGKPDAQYAFGMLEWNAARRDVDRAYSQWSRTNNAAKRPRLTQAELDAARVKWSALPEPEARRAAEAGDSGAQAFVTQLDSNRAQERARLAADWLKRAADQSFPPAEYEMAMRRLGVEPWRVVPTDPQEGLKWLYQAVDHGVEGAQHRLGNLLVEGTLIPPDLGKAIVYLQLAADKGCHRAQYDLAVQYACGHGEPRSSAETPVALLTLAAKGGCAEASFALGQRSLAGFGIEHSAARAYFWFSLAASQGAPKAAAERNKLIASLTPEDRQRIARWQQESKPKD